MPRRATYKCPKCDSRDIAPILYGMPSFGMQDQEMRGEIYRGGCCMEIDAPDRHCNDCEHQWSKADNYKKVG